MKTSIKNTLYILLLLFLMTGNVQLNASFSSDYSTSNCCNAPSSADLSVQTTNFNNYYYVCLDMTACPNHEATFRYREIGTSQWILFGNETACRYKYLDDCKDYEFQAAKVNGNCLSPYSASVYFSSDCASCRIDIHGLRLNTINSSNCRYLVDYTSIAWNDCNSDCSSNDFTYLWTVNSSPVVTPYIDFPGTYDVCLTITSNSDCNNASDQKCKTYDSNCPNRSELLQASTTNNFLIYPNPVQKQFTLDYELPNTESTGLIHLMNAQGQQVRIQNIEGISNRQQFDVANLPNGVYFLSVQSEGTMLYQSKVVINN